jgi:dTDP-D-glucose 4,6-dehydratase
MRMARSILVTGAVGFIGSNFVRWWLERHPDDHLVAAPVRESAWS